ncbi:MAG: hypothetical protein GC191_18430 [Azospirillum sp.]|nr:hypothetical protein [Azospirillum sp.]
MTPTGQVHSEDEYPQLIAEGYVRNPDGTYSRPSAYQFDDGTEVTATDTLIPIAPLRTAPSQVSIPSLAAIGGCGTIAIDFETANAARSSPCSIGLAWIGNEGVSHISHRLIRPKNNVFDGFNIAIHGIRPEDVEDEPEFPEVWEEIAPHLAGRIILAHNASFDMSVLRATLDLYGLPWPEMSYLCTVKIARARWPDLSDHKLPTVAAHLGLEVAHHVASSDADACARIALRAAAEIGCGLDGLPEALGVTVGLLRPGWYQPCSSPLRKMSSAKLNSMLAVPAVDGPLAGTYIAFTGTLQAMTRHEAAALVHAVGGTWHATVRKDTDYLVVGTAPGGDKLAKAATQMDRHGRLKLIDESEFLTMLEEVRRLPSAPPTPPATGR